MYVFSPENINTTLRLANDQKLHGEQFAWFVGTKVGSTFKPNLRKDQLHSFKLG